MLLLFKICPRPDLVKFIIALTDIKNYLNISVVDTVGYIRIEFNTFGFFLSTIWCVDELRLASIQFIDINFIAGHCKNIHSFA